MRETQTHTKRDFEPYPGGSTGPEAAAGDAARETLFECQVCGWTFTLHEADDGATLPDLTAFLALHRKCIRRVLTYGGAFAKATTVRKRGR